jgi:hypothetical protein
MDLEGNSRHLLEILTRHLSGRTVEDYEEAESGLVGLPATFEPSTSNIQILSIIVGYVIRESISQQKWGASKSRIPMGLHSLLQGYLYVYTGTEEGFLFAVIGYFFNLPDFSGRIWPLGFLSL